MTPAGRLGAFITKVKRGSIADVVGHLQAGRSLYFVLCTQDIQTFEKSSLYYLS
jgi:hypothetical protein